MSDIAIVDHPHNSRPTTRSERAGLTKKTQRAVDAMVWDGLPFDEAAKVAGMHVAAMRKALGKPRVMAYLKQQRQVLLGSEGPRNIHRARQIRDAADNMPAVNAIKLLEELGDERSQRGSGANTSPGMTIRVVTIVQQQPVSVPSTTPQYDIDGQAVDIASQSVLSNIVPTDRRPSDAAPALPDPLQSEPPGEN
jgi:hypothetical protein